MQDQYYGTIAINKIQPGYNPRKNFDDLDSLKESIQEKGILTPITVRPRNEHFEIVCGERRYRCAKDLGLTDIPVFIKPMDDETAEDVAFIENKERNNLNSIEEAEFLKYKKEKYNLDCRSLSEKYNSFGSKSKVNQYLKLLTLPNEVKLLLSTRVDNLMFRHAYEITKLLNKEELTKLFEDNKFFIRDNEKRLQEEIEYRQKMQIELADEVIEKELTIKSVQTKVKELLNDLKERDQNILDGIEEEKEKQALFEGIYLHSAENMSELKDKSIHLIVTSPPYFAGKDYEKKMTFEQYQELLKNVFKECERVLCKGGIFCVNIGDIPNYKGQIYFANRLIEDNLPEKLYIKDQVTWLKDAPWQSNPHIKYQDQECYYRYLPSQEHIFIIYKKGGKRKLSGTNRLGAGVTKDEWKAWVPAKWDIASVRNNKDHPAKFPEELPKRLIKLHSCKGDNILDPFLGSGTTVKVARELDRFGFGYEKEKKYKEVIENKLKELSKKDNELKSEDATQNKI